ncbi:MAG: cytochrome c3 family protein [Candidatus Sulfotelmatobacter sp.]|jgi:predicted CXXCH cytochrome family protein
MTCQVLLALRIALITLLSAYLCHAAEHPTRVHENSNCRECHANQIEGKYVHPAIKQGCTVCHVIENKSETTYVSLKQSPSVCLACHQQEIFLYEHLPYSSGWCLRCHDPHASGSPNLVRGNVNDLCLACHLNSPERVASRLPTIVLTVDRTMGHPDARHPVSGKPDALTGLELSCVSCHMPHGGAKRPLLKMGEQIPEDVLNQTTETNDMCRKCHMVLWGLAPDLSAKRKNKKGKEK